MKNKDIDIIAGIEIEEPESYSFASEKAIQLMIEWRKRGFTMKKIANALNANGFKTGRGKAFTHTSCEYALSLSNDYREQKKKNTNGYITMADAAEKMGTYYQKAYKLFTIENMTKKMYGLTYVKESDVQAMKAILEAKKR